MSGTSKLLCLVPDARVAQMSAVRTLRHAQSRRCRVGESATNPDLKIETVRYGAQSDAKEQIHTIVRTGPVHTGRTRFTHSPTLTDGCARACKPSGFLPRLNVPGSRRKTPGGEGSRDTHTHRGLRPTVSHTQYTLNDSKGPQETSQLTR